MFWYVCTGTVEPYNGQDANWRDSVIVFAESPEDALLKVMKYHLGKLNSRSMVYGGKDLEAIY